ncbi:MAG TPA: zinc ribbon domain-containing protein [Candidatus Nitrosotalea sp.]|nr:zinc ribbon domain-containing protein [Candidatus Nitrosotalea sp.]
MAFGGDVDTLSLTFDKLQYIFNGYGQIRDSFLELVAAHRQGKITYIEFFDKIQEGVMRFSALEFLSIKSIFEIKKSLDRRSGVIKNDNNSNIQSNSIPSPTGHSINSFIVAGVLPTLNQDNSQKNYSEINCPQCKTPIKKHVNFCTNCGVRIQ